MAVNNPKQAVSEGSRSAPILEGADAFGLPTRVWKVSAKVRELAEHPSI